MSTVVYLGSIPYDWDENVIKSVVAGSGRVVDVRLGFDYAGKNKGFCFVEYATHDEAQRALPLLNQIKVGPASGSGPFKRLRIELSKEGLRSHASDSKPVLDLNHNYFPPYVMVPPEMVAAGGGPGASTLYQAPTSLPRMPPSLPHNPNLPANPRQSQFGGAQLPQHPRMHHAAGPLYHTPPQQPPQALPMPPALTAASQQLPQPAALPFTTPDKISETLSKIPPPQLVEVIANLKNFLVGPNAARAADFFQISPDLASSASQALLLMGLIDAEVIAESMKAPQQPVAPPAASPYGQLQQPPPQPQQHPQRQAAYSGYGTPPPSAAAPAAAPAAARPPAQWAHLPPQAVAKLANMAPDQANLIAQVLSLPAESIGALPPDQRAMVTNLRAQYL
ncbi:RRM domain-containing protein [[Candida] zeylanoides]